MSRFVRRFDLPAASYPFSIEFFSVYDPDGVRVLHRIEVAGPGQVQIPGRGFFGVPVWLRMRSADGVSTEKWPDGWSRPQLS